MNRNDSPSLRGQVEIYVVDPRGNERLVLTGKNAVTYEGMDAVGKILSGQIDAYLNYVYFGFDSNGSASVVATSVATQAADFHALTGDNDVVRVRTGSHVTEATDANYNDNRVLVSAVADADTTGIVNSKVLTGGLAEITHFGLVVAPDVSDYTEDLLFAAFTPASPVLVPANSGVAMRWRPFFTA